MAGKRGQAGFSLIEVLVALAILAVGLLGLALFQVTAIKGNAIASKWTVATDLAQDQIERFRHAAWTGIASSPAAGYNVGTMTPNYGNLPGAAGDAPPAVRGTQFYRVWYVNPATTAATTMTTITVWCCWRDDASNWHNVMMVLQRTNVAGM